MKSRFGSTGNLKAMGNAGSGKKERDQKDKDLVQKVMGTSGGDNAELAKKIHSRFDRCAPVKSRSHVHMSLYCYQLGRPPRHTDATPDSVSRVSWYSVPAL